MKLSRIIWIKVIGLYVYWGASTDTLSNWLNALADKLTNGQPLDQTLDNHLAEIDKIDTLKSYRIFNMVLLVCSIIAFGLSIFYQIVFKKSAKKRNVFDQLKRYTGLAATAVLLTAFKHDTVNWWSVLSIPIFTFLFVYPLFYIRYYRYFRWAVATIYDLLAFALGTIHVVVCVMYDDSALTFGGLFICILLCFWFMWKHRKFDTCSSCKNYVNIKHIDHTIEETNISYKDVDVAGAAGHTTTTSYDKYGHRIGQTSTATGWK